MQNTAKRGKQNHKNRTSLYIKAGGKVIVFNILSGQDNTSQKGTKHGRDT